MNDLKPNPLLVTLQTPSQQAANQNVAPVVAAPAANPGAKP